MASQPANQGREDVRCEIEDVLLGSRPDMNNQTSNISDFPANIILAAICPGGYDSQLGCLTNLGKVCVRKQI